MNAKSFLFALVLATQILEPIRAAAGTLAEITWGDVTNGIRSGVKLEFTSSGTIAQIYVAYTDAHVTALLSGTSSSNLARYNIPLPHQAFEAHLINGEGNETAKSAEGKKYGKSLPKRIKYPRKDWVILAPKPTQIGSIDIQKHFEIGNQIGTNELIVIVNLFSQKRGEEVKAVRLPPVRVKVPLRLNK